MARLLPFIAYTVVVCSNHYIGHTSDNLWVFIDPLNFTINHVEAGMALSVVPSVILSQATHRSRSLFQHQSC